MTSPRRLRFVHGVVAWMLAAVLLMAAVGSLSLELVFVVSLIGVLVVFELTAPRTVTPAWRTRATVVILLGLVGFSVLVVRRLLEILPPEVLPI